MAERGAGVDFDLKKRTQESLLRAGVLVRVATGRPRKALAPGEEIWRLGSGPEAPAVLATPLPATGAPPSDDNPLGLPRLWIGEYVSPRRAERMVEEGRAFADAVGNAHVRLPGLIVQVLGRKPDRPRAKQAVSGDREWRGATLRVLFHLLCEPALIRRPLRDLAGMGETALGTVVHLIDDLERSAHVVRLGGRERRFVPDRALVERWVEEYIRKLRARLLLGRYEPTDMEAWGGFEPHRAGARWGGESAAELLGTDLRPGIRTLYTGGPLPALLRAAKLRPADDGVVEVRRAFWSGDLEAPREDVVPPLLVVADLIATADGRCIEAAQTIRREFVDGLLGET